MFLVCDLTPLPILRLRTVKGGRVRSGLSRALASYRVHPKDRRRGGGGKQGRPFVCPPKGWLNGGERSVPRGLFAHLRERTATDHISLLGIVLVEEKMLFHTSWVLRHKSEFFGFLARTHARTHAHTLIAREFVGCLSDKFYFLVD